MLKNIKPGLYESLEKSNMAKANPGLRSLGECQ